MTSGVDAPISTAIDNMKLGRTYELGIRCPDGSVDKRCGVLAGLWASRCGTVENGAFMLNLVNGGILTLKREYITAVREM